MLPALVIAFAALLAFVSIRTARQYYALRDFSGPWSVGFSRLWLLWANGSGKMHLVFTKVNDEHGKYTALSSAIEPSLYHPAIVVPCSHA